MFNLNTVYILGKWLRKYAVLIALLTILTVELVTVQLNGMGPRPQLPPRGYEAESGNITLQWNKGNRDKPITVQVSKTKDFENIVFERQVSGTTTNWGTSLERGQTYYWRLMQDEQPSSISRFTISKQHVKL